MNECRCVNVHDLCELSMYEWLYMYECTWIILCVHDFLVNSFLYCFCIYFYIYLFIWLHWVLVVCRVFDLHCSMWDLVPWSGMEPGPHALEVWSLTHCTTREVPMCSFFWGRFWVVSSWGLLWMMVLQPSSRVICSSVLQGEWDPRRKGLRRGSQAHSRGLKDLSLPHPHF